MASINGGNLKRHLLTTLSVGLGVALLAGCGESNTSSQSPKSSPASVAAAMAQPGDNKRESALRKVPFGNQPCQSLSDGDQKGLGLSTTGAGKGDRAPATLPFDNLCFYGGIHVGYMTATDNDFNQEGNRSTSRPAPAGG